MGGRAESRQAEGASAEAVRPVRYLLDSHTLLWWCAGDQKLSSNARKVIESQSEIIVSAASVWEIAIKSRLGKLPKGTAFARRLPAVLIEQGFTSLPISAEHAMRAGWLDGDHRDPFDRMIAAQALAEGLIVVTNDREIDALGAETIW